MRFASRRPLAARDESATGLDAPSVVEVSIRTRPARCSTALPTLGVVGGVEGPVEESGTALAAPLIERPIGDNSSTPHGARGSSIAGRFVVTNT